MTSEEIEKNIEDAALKNHPRNDSFPDDHIRETFTEGAHYGLKLGRAQGIRDVIAYIESRWSVKISEDLKNKFAAELAVMKGGEDGR